MNAEAKHISVSRVANGWVLTARRPDMYESFGDSATMVARTPGELAQILTDWAAAQEKKERGAS